MLLVTLANKPLVGDHLLDVLDVDEGSEDEQSWIYQQLFVIVFLVMFEIILKIILLLHC